jgi:hypothetical protein
MVRLSSYGSVCIDYDAGMLTLGRDQGPLSTNVHGIGRIDIPAQIRAGTNRSVPLSIDSTSVQVPDGSANTVTAVRVLTSVTIGPQTFTFTVDTGASLAVVGPRLASAAKLVKLRTTSFTYAGLDCRVNTTTYNLPAWQLAGLALRPQSVASNVLPPGVDGLLGSGTLQKYSPIVVDFTDGELLLTHHP